MDRKSHKKYLSILYEKYEKCLSPGMNCNEAAIKAHSIQNARVLERLSEDGHIVALEMKPNNDGPILQFAKIGRNLASTFTGLCAKHDAELFREIDQTEFNPKYSKQKFLLAYRAVTKELHAALRAGYQLQVAYVKQAGAENRNPDITPLGVEATNRMLIAYDIYQYRARHFDRYFGDHRASKIQSDIQYFPVAEPTIAASSLFSIPSKNKNLAPSWVILNIFPVSDKSTVVIFTYSERDRLKFRKQNKRVFFGSMEQRKLETSKVIIGRTENFVISPRFFGSWSREKSDTIIHYCRKTVMGSEVKENNANLCLFS